MPDRKLIEFLEWFLGKCERLDQARFLRNELIALLVDRDGLNFEKKIRPRINYLTGKGMVMQYKSISNVVYYDLNIERLKNEIERLHNEVD